MNHYYFSKEGLIGKIIIQDGLYKADRDYNIDKAQNILGIEVGDKEQKLIELFPNSTKYIENMKEYFKDNDGNYEVYVRILENKGSVNYELNNGIVKKITIKFLYRN